MVILINKLYLWLSVQCLLSAGEDQMEFLFPERSTLANPVECWRSLISNRKTQDHMNAWLRTPEAKTQSRGGSPSMVGQNYFRDEINVTFFEGTIQPYLKSIQTCMTFFLTWNTKEDI